MDRRDSPPLDRAALERLRERATADAPDFFVEMVTMFVSELDRRRITIAEAFARNDSAAMARVAHSLGGSAKLFGATRLATLCGRLQAVPYPSLDEACAIVAEIDRECSDVRDFVADEALIKS
jgi:HPt (histidine-containing phosphotransfer) domain-containing protein